MKKILIKPNTPCQLSITHSNGYEFTIDITIQEPISAPKNAFLKHTCDCCGETFYQLNLEENISIYLQEKTFINILKPAA